jgi:4-amino-4-deoxy-L-arabinose transferase-like glycosyltransferase
MSPLDNQQPEGLPEQANKSEDLDSLITDKRQQIAALRRELAELEQRQREIKRRRALQVPARPAASAGEQTKEQASASSTGIMLLLAGFAFLLAGLGQRALHNPVQIGGGTVNGWALYGSAAVLFIIAFGRTAPAQFARAHWHDLPNGVSLSLPRSFWLFLILAILTMVVSLVLFNKPATLGSAWILHVTSVLLFSAAFIPFDRLRSISFQPRPGFTTQLVCLLPILAVLALAAFARFWQLSTFPFGEWTDEAQNGLTAAQILQDPSFRPVFIPETLIPSHFNYLIALSFSLFGISAIGVRIVVALFGLIGVLFAYLLFRRWFGEWIGLFAATILTVMRYHLTFSRFGLHGIATPAFEFAALYFLDRALAGKKSADFAWFGLTLGFGLAFYFAFRLFPVALVIFLLIQLVSVAFAKREKRAMVKYYVKVMWPQALIALLGLVLAVAPIVQFALKNQDLFFARTGAVSIFQNRDDPNLRQALQSNVLKHLEMFNGKGDNNGRHNLPGAPMLDPVMGVLFVLGVAHSLWRWRDPPSQLMLLLLMIMLQGGILSLDFEAPQAYRSIGVIPALVYFITVPIAVVSQGVRRMLRSEGPAPLSKLPDLALSLGLVTVLAVVTYLNFDMFFNKQKNDPAAWASYSTAETLVAKEMNRLAATHDFIVSALYYDPPTVRFLAGDITNSQRWTVTDRLPVVHEDNGQGLVMLFDEKLVSAYNDAQRLYPNANFIEHHAPAGGGTMLWEAVLTPNDLRSVQGVTARYFQGNPAEGKPVKEEILPQISVDWTKVQLPAEPFLAELRTTLHISEYGSYRFSLRGATSDAKLWIDENPVTDAPLTLSRGNHALRLQASSSKNPLELWWQPPSTSEMQPVPGAYLFRPPVTNNGLLGAYYPSPDWSGEPAFTQIDPQIDFYFHIIPLPRPYTVEWTGKLFAPTPGDYRFALNSVDNSQLKIDHSLVVDNPNGHTTIEGEAMLTQGWHDINLRFADKTGGTQIYLYWTPPGTTENVLVPAHYLSPPMGQYPVSPDDLIPTQP